MNKSTPLTTIQAARSNTYNYHAKAIEEVSNQINAQSKLGRDFIFLPSTTPYPVLNYFEIQGFTIDRISSGLFKINCLKIMQQ